MKPVRSEASRYLRGVRSWSFSVTLNTHDVMGKTGDEEYYLLRLKVLPQCDANVARCHSNSGLIGKDKQNAV